MCRERSEWGPLVVVIRDRAAEFLGNLKILGNSSVEMSQLLVFYAQSTGTATSRQNW